MENTKTCHCPHHKIIPVLVVLFGLTFLAGNLNWLSMDAVNVIWPVIIILGGLQKLASGMCKCCGTSHQM